MTMLKTVTYLLLLNTFCVLAEQQFNYYWREYTGLIPEDAVPGGTDQSDNPTYIGQGYVKNRGIIPGVIYPNQKYITVPTYGSEKVQTHIQILCSPNLKAFKWVKTSTGNFYVDTINKHAVRGGLENDLVLHIGRISYQGEILIGKITANNLDEAPLYFIYRNEEKRSNSYEMLIYERDNNFIEVRSS